MGFKVSEEYAGGNYLAADDIGNQQLTLQVVGVDMEALADNSQKLAVSFGDFDKVLLLNRTNAQTFAELFGDETDGWIGKHVTLYTTKTQFQNRRVSAVRVRLATAAEVAAASGSASA